MRSETPPQTDTHPTQLNLTPPGTPILINGSLQHHGEHYPIELYEK